MTRNNILKATACIAVTLPLFFVSTQAYSDCIIFPGQTDSNNDGFADELVSPDANISGDSDIDCSEHQIAAGANIVSSTISLDVRIDSEGTVKYSNISNESVIMSRAKIVRSGIDRSTVSGGATVRSDSFVSDFSTILAGAYLSGAQVFESEIGRNSLIYTDARVQTAILRENVKVLKRATVEGQAGFGQVTLIREGVRIYNDAYVEGPIDLGEDSRIGERAVLIGSKFVGPDFNMGYDSFIDVGGDIGSRVKIANRVSIGNDPDIGSDSSFGNDTQVGNLLETGGSVTVRKRVTIGGEVFLGDDVVIANESVVGNDVTVGAGTVIGFQAVIGNNVVIGDNAIVRDYAVVPDNFVISAGTVYPTDY